MAFFPPPSPFLSFSKCIFEGSIVVFLHCTVLPCSIVYFKVEDVRAMRTRETQFILQFFSSSEKRCSGFLLCHTPNKPL